MDRFLWIFPKNNFPLSVGSNQDKLQSKYVWREVGPISTTGWCRDSHVLMAKSKWLSRQLEIRFPSPWVSFQLHSDAPLRSALLASKGSAATALPCCSFYICQLAGQVRPGYRMLAVQYRKHSAFPTRKNIRLVCTRFLARAVLCNLPHRYGRKPGEEGVYTETPGLLSARKATFLVGRGSVVCTCLSALCHAIFNFFL